MRDLNSQARARRGKVRALVALILLTAACGGEPAEQVTPPQFPSSVPTSAVAERAQSRVEGSQAPLDTPAPQSTESPSPPPATKATAPAPTGAERYDTDPADTPPTTSSTEPSPAPSFQPPGGASEPLSDAAAGAAGSSGAPASVQATAESGESAEGAPATLPAETTSLRVRRGPSADVTCGLFSSGEQVTLVADGFAPGSAVSPSVVGVSATGTALSPAAIPAVTADADGRIEVSWTVPSAPDAATDAVPRGFVVKATGTRPSGAVLVAGSLRPIVAYPGVAPCAVDDAAATEVGQPVRVAVLGNDRAPSGGSLDAASVRLELVHNADVVVSAADGSLTYMPDAGFVGTDTFYYWVYDNWGIGVRAEVTVVVSGGCTITGTAGVREIVGTEGDDVICVPDPDDYRAFHIIDVRAPSAHAGAPNSTVIGAMASMCPSRQWYRFHHPVRSETK